MPPECELVKVNVADTLKETRTRPAPVVEDVRRLLLVMQRLDRGRMLCELKGIEPGQDIALSRDHVVTAFATAHTVPALGFLVWDRRLKLKDEYVGLPGDQIRDLR